MVKQRGKWVSLLIVGVMAGCQQLPTSAPEPATSLGGNWREANLVLPGLGSAQQVAYEIVGDEAIFQGDIILGKVDAQGNLIPDALASQGITKDSNRWPGGIIPFRIASSVSSSGRSNIASAIAEWEAKTPLDFVPRTSQSSFVEFVRGTSAGACSSRVGRDGGRQEIKLTPSGDCSKGVLIHEIGHAIGLYHEQSREDRDRHVTIKWDNIESDREHNFDRVVSGATDNASYDFGSIMHYGAFDFCKKNILGGCVGPTIVTKPTGTAIGQRTGLSQGDVNAVLSMYNIAKMPRFVEDVSGDGRQDIVGFGNDGVYVSLSTGSGFAAKSRWVTGYSYSAGRWQVAKHLRLLADISGDGRKDVVGFGDAGVYVSLSTGSSFAPARFVLAEFGYNQGWRIDQNPRLLVDVNGDTRQDIVGFGNDGVWTALSTGSGFASPSFIPDDFAYDAGWRTEKHPRLLADVNGDKRSDIVGFGDDGVWLALANGSGFNRARFVLADFAVNANGWRVEKNPRFLSDVNGDGRADIVGIGNDDIYVSLSLGSGFAQARYWGTGFAYNQGWRVERHPRVLSTLNGDGRADIVGFGNDGVWTALSTGSGFTSAGFVLAELGYNQGWRIDQNPRLLADVNGDKLADIVGFGNDGVWTALSTGSGFGQARFVLADFGYKNGWR